MYSLLKRQTGTQHKHIVCLPKEGKLATFYNLNAREKTNETDGTAREKEITAQQAVAVVQNRQWFRVMEACSLQRRMLQHVSD